MKSFVFFGFGILLVMVSMFNSIALATNQIGPMDKVKAMAMVKGKALGGSDGNMYMYSVINNEARYSLNYDDGKKLISISKQIKSPDDKERYITGKRVSILYDEKINSFGLKVDELGTGGGKWTKINWNTAWEIVYEWLREIEQ